MKYKQIMALGHYYKIWWNWRNFAIGFDFYQSKEEGRQYKVSLGFLHFYIQDDKY